MILAQLRGRPVVSGARVSSANRLGRAALGLAKGCHPGPVAVVTAASIGMARVFGGQRNASLRVGAAVLAGQLAIGWQNDWIDAERDRLAARLDKPISSDLIGRGTVGTAAVLAAAACVPASAALGRRAAVAHLVAVASAVSYNVALKRTVLSIVTYGVSFGLLPVVAHDASPWEDTTPGWAIAAGALLGMAAHLVNVLPDRDADRELGVMGVPQRLSPDASLALATALLLGASGSIAFGAGGLSRRTVSAFGASCAVSGATLLAGRRAGGRMPFRLLLVDALVQIALVSQIRAVTRSDSGS
jgi:4-hydroxybenzoate polyprenyltransferase